MELIDTHCHLGFEPLVDDIEGVIERSIAAGVVGWVTIGTDPQQNVKAVELANRCDNMYAAVGIHPHFAKDITSQTMEQLKELSQNEKVVAIGETGFDFHYNHSPKFEQERAFVGQLKIARESNLPVIVHSREAFYDTMSILDQHGEGVKKIVFHCFSGTPKQAETVLKKGHYISFTGVVTFKNAQKTQEVARIIPLERLMLETDCPYMSPEPMRKQKINEPALMIHTAKFIADLKNMDIEDFAAAVTETSTRFFNIPKF